MGQRWGNDDFIAYIELGGLGHWGEWHVHSDAAFANYHEKKFVRITSHRFNQPFLKRRFL